ncbi:hypothetical protein MPH_00990 [Macrophomina phaseolina MS6]|uniref:Heterokaryon incompatibility n=1 Tax=Macrophomina phaseolina (strain MS6) TaxID=1126212 RepID=K2SYK6_MACPH|nr:hypothetical protein MPH_00990 [Macrophomina phaseolina MS6]
MKTATVSSANAIQLIIPQDLEGEQRNGGFYDPIRYRDWGYSKVSRNAAENRLSELDDEEETRETTHLISESHEMDTFSWSLQAQEYNTDSDVEMDQDFDDLPGRHFRPTYLCFLTTDPTNGIRCETWKVTDWIKEYGDDAGTDFVFLSYTRKQFCVGTEEEIANWDLPDEEIRAAYISLAKQDRQTLIQYGIEAAQSAGKSAFWLDFECIRDADNTAKAHSQSDDVYRICDIIRAAHSLVILVGPSIQLSRLPNTAPQEYNYQNMTSWLHEWGSRLWTLPEILLCSPEHRVKIYAIGGPSPPEQLAKRNFAARGAWEDAKLVRQLVDHYESSIHLTPLELVSIGLECFARRQTEQFNRGDIAYALMGLLRRRPAVHKADTGFEAFARLSLANDSDALLERLLCMLPVRPSAPWHEIKDAWGARLWDIEPRCCWTSIVANSGRRRRSLLASRGMVDIGQAERHLFGFNHGRLKWSTNGSMLSRHRYEDGECVAMPPALKRPTDVVEGQTIFTLIDTYAMTATCFYADRPPAAVIVCGQEGGMQRAVLCSYDWRTNTFARETVLRMKTLVLDRMFRVDRFRFALRRQMYSEAPHESEANTRSAYRVENTKSKQVHGVWPTWKIDLLLLLPMWVSPTLTV